MSFTEEGVRLVVKYLRTKYSIVGHLDTDELDYVKNLLAYNSTLFDTITNTFTLTKENGKSLMKYHKYFDVKCKNYNTQFNEPCNPNTSLVPASVNGILDGLIGKPIANAYIDKHGDFYAKIYSNQTRKQCNLNIPWRYVDVAYGNKLRKLATYEPFILQRKNKNGEATIKGLCVRFDKSKLLDVLDRLNLYDRKTVEKDWVDSGEKFADFPSYYFEYNSNNNGNNSSDKKYIPLIHSPPGRIHLPILPTFCNVASSLYINEDIAKCMKTILTPITLDNDMKYDHNIVPENIRKTGVVLKKYQLENVKWMHALELNSQHYGLEIDDTKEIIPHVHIDLSTKIIYRNAKPARLIEPLGGGLFDEVGLGKTLSVITLCCMNPPDENIGSFNTILKVSSSKQTKSNDI